MLDWNQLKADWAECEDLKCIPASLDEVEGYVGALWRWLTYYSVPSDLHQRGLCHDMSRLELCKWNAEVSAAYDFYEIMTCQEDSVAWKWNYGDHTPPGPTPERVEMCKALIEELEEMIAFERNKEKE